MLTLILGRAGSGKTAFIVDEIKKSVEQRIAGNVMIVPEQYSHEAERGLSGVCGDSVSLYAEVISFSRLCSRVFAETGGAGLKPLDKGGRILLMSLALTELAPMLKVYNIGRRRTDFLQRLLRTYDEFYGSNIRARAIFDAAETAQGQLGDKLSDLALLFAAYDARIPEDMLDPGQKLDLLSEKLPMSTVGSSGHVYIDGFTDFTGQEMTVVEKFIKKGADVTICLTCDGLEGIDPIFELPRMTARRLLRTAQSSGQGTLIKAMPEGGLGKNEGLRFLEKELFSYSDTEFEGEDGSVELYSPPGVMEECELAAALTRKLVMEKGCRWRDIAVAAADWSKYEGAAESVFGKYGVPVMLSKKSDILEKPILALILSALDILSSDWDYGSVFKYFKTNLTGLSLDERDMLENYVLKWNLRGSSMWTRSSDWTFNPEGFSAELTDAGRERLGQINEIRRRAVPPLKRLEKSMKEAETAGGKIAALYGFLEEINLPETLSQKAKEFRAGGRLQLAEEYEQLWELLVAAMEQTSGILDDVLMDTDEFARLFRLVLSQYQVGTIPVSLDRTSLGDMARMRRRGVRYLIVMGATDDAMPGTRIQSGVLTDLEMGELTALGLSLGDTPDDRILREMNLIYSSLTLPSERLIITYPSDGVSRPSFIVGRLKKLFGIREKRVDCLFRTYAEMPCFELAAALETQDSCAAAAAEYFRRSEELRHRLEAIHRAAAIPRGRLSREAAERLYSKRQNLTASRVDKYHACRFSYFMQYGLKAKPRRKAEFDAPEMGTFMHYILEHVASEAEELGGFGALEETAIRAITNTYVQKYIDEKLDGFRDKTNRFRYLFTRLTEDTRRIVLDMARELSCSDFRPMAFELEFSPQGDMMPAEISDGSAAVAVHGKVDRVDGWVRGDTLYLRVVDYKTGSKTFDLSDIWYGMGLQMLIYLFVLQKNGQGKFGRQVIPAGVLYAPARDVILQMPRNSDSEEIERQRAKKTVRRGLLLNDPEVLEAMEKSGEPKYIPVRFTKDGTPTGDSLAAMEQLGKLSRHIDKTLLAMGRDMQSGVIDADPYYKNPNDNACLYCDYFEACHFDADSGGDRQRYLTKLKTGEVWEKIGEECGK